MNWDFGPSPEALFVIETLLPVVAAVMLADTLFGVLLSRWMARHAATWIKVILGTELAVCLLSLAAFALTSGLGFRLSFLGFAAMVVMLRVLYATALLLFAGRMASRLNPALPWNRMAALSPAWMALFLAVVSLPALGIDSESLPAILLYGALLVAVALVVATAFFLAFRTIRILKATGAPVRAIRWARLGYCLPFFWLVPLSLGLLARLFPEGIPNFVGWLAALAMLAFPTLGTWGMGMAFLVRREPA